MYALCPLCYCYGLLIIFQYSCVCRRASQVVSPSDLPDSPGGTTPHSPASRRRAKEKVQPRKEAQTPPLPQAVSSESTTQQTDSGQFNQPAGSTSNADSQAVTNLLGLSGMFGSLSGLASLQGPDIDEGMTNNYSQRLLSQYCQPISAQMQYQTQQVPQQYQQQQPFPPRVVHVPPMRTNDHELSKENPHQAASVMNPHLHASGGALHHQMARLNLSHHSAPSQHNHSTTEAVHTQHSAESTPMNLGKTTSLAAEVGQSKESSSVSSAPARRPGILRPTGHTPLTAAQPFPVSIDSTAVTKAAFNNSKVDQFLTDTVRTYAVEGTPGPNSTRSSLSALTFLDLDEPETPSMRPSLSKELTRSGKITDRMDDSSNKPLGMCSRQLL